DKISIKTYVDGEPVNLIAKSIDVAKGQPIKVSEINFNSPCGACMVHNAKGICIVRRWEDVWTEWRTGKEIIVNTDASGSRTGIGGIKHGVIFNLLIDKCQVLLGNETITIDAGNESSYNTMYTLQLKLKEDFQENWKDYERILVGENYTLIANVEDDVMRNETYLYGTDLAVTDLEVNDTYFDGDEVNITAVIENLGLKNATEFWVNFSYCYDCGSVYEVTIPINSTFFASGLEAGNKTNISVSWNASLYKKGKFWKHNYEIHVTINTLDNAKYEENTNNDLMKKSVSVERSRDFFIQNLVFAMDNETLDPAHLPSGANVTVNATLNITNLANRGGTVNVSFYVDKVDTEKERGYEIGSGVVEFDAGNGTGHIKINWSLWDFSIEKLVGNEWLSELVKIGGNHTLIVVADPENETYELNELNNKSILPIHVDAPELTITNIGFEHDNSEISENEGVNISIDVANYGDENATNVSLAVYDCANRHIEDNDTSVYGSLHPGDKEAPIERENAIAMRLYLDTDIDMGKVVIRNGNSNQIELIGGSGVIFKDELSYYENFHGWTPWIIGNNVSIEAIGNASAKVSKVYYLERSNRIFPLGNENKTYNFTINKGKTTVIHVGNWTASTAGEHIIVATIDPENEIQEYNEFNNTFARYIAVNTTDLAVHDIGLKWLNSTQIGENEIIRDNDTVRIVANVTNTGVASANSFNVRILVDNDEKLNETEDILLEPGNSTELSVEWKAEVGTHVIKVEVDYNNEINETNETNNIAALEIYVRGAEVKGNITWQSEGLHGQILFDPKQPYDEDEVNITAVINNTGEVAASFSLALMFDYKPADVKQKFSDDGEKSWDLNYDNATCIYLYINIPPDISEYNILAIYDRNGGEIARTDKSCWVHVPGDTAEIEEIISSSMGPSPGHIVYSISAYPVYKSNLTAKRTLNPNSSVTISMTKNVTAGNHTVMLFIDPEGEVPEDVDNKSDNIVIREMQVLPTRDFIVTEVEPEKTSISDAEKINITANVTDIGLKEIAEGFANKTIHLSSSSSTAYRNSTTKVRFVDYETETRIHK
ncbi:MAG: hypothetical protein J7I99_05325, partial [Methanophagales archaeon]|nr:hypothetical protein [Methanophagales archaeon]